MTVSPLEASLGSHPPDMATATGPSSRHSPSVLSGDGAPPAQHHQGKQDQSPPALSWYQQFRRVQIVQGLEAVQDLIAVSLCVGLFCVMVLQLRSIFSSLLTTKPQFHAITSDILFILILVELFRLLIIYLQEQRVSIGVSVEVAIVSVLREVIVSGVLETDWRQILAVCLFLATAALLLVVRVWIPPTFAGVDPEARMSARARLSGNPQ
jgi:uncharacterized membrane protein (DUF373 family)